MPYLRDPLSVQYDEPVRTVMMRAIRASRDGRGVQAYVASPQAEHRHPDEGGRTAHERAFTRAAYYLVWRAPLNAGRVPDWSLKVTWGPDSALQASSHGRMARPVRLRVWPRAQARVRGARWTADPGLQSGGIGSGRERFGNG